MFCLKNHIAVIKFNLNTNPNGSGLVFHASNGRYFHTLDVYWFGIGVQTNYLPMFADNQYAVNAKPYCTSAAGIYSVGENVDDYFSDSQFKLSGFWLFNLASWNTNIINGCAFSNGHIGWNGFSSLNVDMDLCSNGTHFGFVPLQSALDYGNGLNLPLNHNIKNENINDKLSRTPFDVIIGYAHDDYPRNHSHSNEYNDPLIYNVTGQAAPNCLAEEININDPNIAKNYSYAYYDADLVTNCEVKRSLMCLEIGDEQMYLENWTLNREATFQTQYDMLVNERNPYYEYPSQIITIPEYDGIYSKENPFLINSNGFALFKTDPTNSPSGLGFVYNNNFSGDWDFDPTFMAICVEDYAAGKSYSIPDTDSPKDTLSRQKEIYARLYPNPTYGEGVMLEYDFLSEDEVGVQIFEVSGKKAFELKNLAEGANTMPLEIGHLESGMYLVNVYTASERETIRLIIH